MGNGKRGRSEVRRTTQGPQTSRRDTEEGCLWNRPPSSPPLPVPFWTLWSAVSKVVAGFCWWGANGGTIRTHTGAFTKTTPLLRYSWVIDKVSKKTIGLGRMCTWHSLVRYEMSFQLASRHRATCPESDIATNRHSSPAQATHVDMELGPCRPSF